MSIKLQLAPNEVVRALSWNQPFASLMLHNKIETRNRPTNVRGKVLICACLKTYNTETVNAISGKAQMERIDLRLSTQATSFFGLPRGVALGIGDLVECRPMIKEDEDRCFVQYREGLWCWVFNDIRRIKPFRFKGKQGWSILTPDQIAKIEIDTDWMTGFDIK